LKLAEALIEGWQPLTGPSLQELNGIVIHVDSSLGFFNRHRRQPSRFGAGLNRPLDIP